MQTDSRRAWKIEWVDEIFHRDLFRVLAFDSTKKISNNNRTAGNEGKTWNSKLGCHRGCPWLQEVVNDTVWREALQKHSKGSFQRVESLL
eukprot:Gb_40286 [translate_table: standard]